MGVHPGHEEDGSKVPLQADSLCEPDQIAPDHADGLRAVLLLVVLCHRLVSGSGQNAKLADPLSPQLLDAGHILEHMVNLVDHDPSLVHGVQLLRPEDLLNNPPRPAQHARVHAVRGQLDLVVAHGADLDEGRRAVVQERQPLEDALGRERECVVRTGQKSAQMLVKHRMLHALIVRGHDGEVRLAHRGTAAETRRRKAGV
eukprot:scaffold529_cov308-Pinguiococcus_pyrenoidosus.AAC.8